MVYKILADIVVFLHFLWIIFLVSGFVLTFSGFFRKDFFDRWLFRLLHLFGIIYASVLAVLGKYCPLTILENSLSNRYDPSLTYRGAFIVQYLEGVVYPDVNLLVIHVPMYLLVIFVITLFFLKPPERLKAVFKKRRADSRRADKQ